MPAILAPGRYVRLDGVAQTLTLNRYSFAANNPIKYGDPSGLYPDDPLRFLDDTADVLTFAEGLMGAIGTTAEIVVDVIADKGVKAMNDLGSDRGARVLDAGNNLFQGGRSVAGALAAAVTGGFVGFAVVVGEGWGLGRSIGKLVLNLEPAGGSVWGNMAADLFLDQDRIDAEVISRTVTKPQTFIRPVSTVTVDQVLNRSHPDQRRFDTMQQMKKSLLFDQDFDSKAVRPLPGSYPRVNADVED